MKDGRWGRYLLLAVFAGALITYGGVMPWARLGLIAAAGVAALVVAVGIGGNARPVALVWIVALFLPPAVLAAVQLSDLVGVHPWAARDAALLGTHPAWSLDPDATLRFLCWTVGVAAVAAAAALAFRGPRQQQLVAAVVGLAAAHAGVALAVLVIDPNLLDTGGGVRASGSFIYPNHAAALWGACLPLAMVLAARSNRRWLVAVALLVVALVLSGSRGGILVATAVSAPFAWTLLPRRRRLWWAAGGGVVLAGYLAVIGIEMTSHRFERLVATSEGVDLNGRVVMMKHGAELAREAGWLGSGAGSTETVFWRGRSTEFDNFRVDHLHSDPLEWWLEFGWVGVAAVVGGGLLAAFSLRDRGASRTTADHADHTRRLLRLGAALGLLDLLLHSCADFVFHLEALALLAALLVASLAAGAQAAVSSPPRSSWRPRLLLTLLGLAALGAALVLAPFEDEALLARRTRDALHFHALHPELPLRPVIDAALAVAEPQSIVLLLARLRARTDLELHDIVTDDSARYDLAQLAQRVPGQPEAWAERLRGQLTGRDLPGPGMETTANRLLTQAPGWPFGRFLMAVASGSLPAGPARTQLAIAVMSIGAPLPDQAWPLLAKALGRQRLAGWLEANGSTLQLRSALAWLRLNACARVWHAVWTSCPPTGELPAAQAMLRLAESSAEDADIRAILPRDPAGRQAQAALFALAGLPQAPGLAEALTRDGQPYASWVPPPDLYRAADRERVVPVISGYLDLPWARVALAEADKAANAVPGRTSNIGPRSDPRLVLLALSTATGPEADRLELCLHSHRDADWHGDAGSKWAWTWWFAEAGGRIALPANGWVGAWVDGTWWGWTADAMEVGPTLPPGLHRIAIVTPD